MSGGWGCVYKLSSWRKKLPPFPEINAQHDIAMHYCICANDQILKKNIESVPFVCWCRRNKSESRQYFLNGDIDEETLVKACEIIKKQEEVKQETRYLNLLDEWKEKLGIKEK